MKNRNARNSDFDADAKKGRSSFLKEKRREVGMLETFNAFVTKINGFVWGPVMLILLVWYTRLSDIQNKNHSEKNHYSD